MILNVIGISISIILFTLVSLIILSLIFINLKFPKNKLLIKISIFILDFFHLQLKILLKKLFPEYDFDLALIEARNDLNKKGFSESQRRIFLAPHCMRSPDCPATSTQYGVQCIECGKCKFAKIMKEARKNDYSLFILAGSSFVKKLIKEYKPDGILLLGCSYEINKVMMALDGMVSYGVILLRDGCVNTDADLNKIFEAMRLGKKIQLDEIMDHANRRS